MSDSDKNQSFSGGEERGESTTSDREEKSQTDSERKKQDTTPTDKPAQGFKDEDFIPKFSPVRSKRAPGETTGTQSIVENPLDGGNKQLVAPEPQVQVSGGSLETRTGEIDITEFGFHKHVKDAHCSSADGIAPYMVPASVAPGVAPPVMPSAEPAPLLPSELESFDVDSLISQSEDLDEIWEPPVQSPQENFAPQVSAPPLPQTDLPATVEIPKAGNVLHASSLTGIPAMSPPPPPESWQERKERSAMVRRSLYWVVKEARLVTHGVFSDYEHSVRNDGSEMAPLPLQIDMTLRPMPRVVGPDEEPLVVDQSPTVLSPRSAETEVSPKDPGLKPELYKDADGNSVKPDIAISQRITTTRGRDQRITDDRMRNSQAVTADRLHDAGNDSEAEEQSERLAQEERQSSELSTTAQRRISASGSESSDGAVGNGGKFKGKLASIGTVFVLCVACGIVMYDWVNSTKNADVRPAPGLQQPASDESEKSSEARPDESRKATDRKLIPSAKKSAVEDDFRRAIDLEQEKKYERALERFDAVISSDGKQIPQALHGRGRVYTKLQRYEEALRDLNDAAQLDPKNELVLIDLAAVKYLLNDFSGAAREYERILSVHENDVDALYGRGISYAGMGQNQQALADFENVVKLKPGYDMAYRQMCKAYLALGQPDKAEAAITVAMKACGSDADLYFSRALCRYQLGRKEDSIADYNKAVDLSPTRKEYYNDRGYVLMDLGRSDEARKDFQKALALDPRYKLAADNLKRLRKAEKSKQ